MTVITTQPINQSSYYLTCLIWSFRKNIIVIKADDLVFTYNDNTFFTKYDVIASHLKS